MPAIRTEITEIVTGLAMLGFGDLDHALAARPTAVHNVTGEHFDRLLSARAGGRHDAEFEAAWGNGVIFARADDGLRGRPPWRVEWKGPHRPPGYEQVPADLRVDHVYLVSCKYGSNILHNSSPAQLFDRGLAARGGGRGADWYAEVAPEAYQDLYDGCRLVLGSTGLPDRAAGLEPEHRKILKTSLGRRWPEGVDELYQWFAVAVSQASAERWLAALDTKTKREEMLWRLLRLQPAPYFVLGQSVDAEPLRYRVGTPWDFREHFDLRTFDVWGDAKGQPLVRWRAEVSSRATGERSAIEGHVEVRWSHGRFGGVPEAKVYLDTRHHDVAGYFVLT